MDFLNYIFRAIIDAGLFLSIGFLPWIAVALIMQILSTSLRNSLAGILGVQGYIYLTFPGVMLHETGHALFCLIFRHKIVEMRLFSPEKDGRLGYVIHTYDPGNVYQRVGNFFIGTGPIWFGLAVLCLITHLLLPGIMQQNDSFITTLRYFFTADFWVRWQSYLWLYLALSIASHITLSAPDLAGSIDGAVAIVTTVLLCFLLFGWCGEWEKNAIGFFQDIFLASCGLFSFVLVLLLVFCITGRIIAGK